MNLYGLNHLCCLFREEEEKGPGLCQLSSYRLGQPLSKLFEKHIRAPPFSLHSQIHLHLVHHTTALRDLTLFRAPILLKIVQNYSNCNILL